MGTIVAKRPIGISHPRRYEPTWSTLATAQPSASVTSARAKTRSVFLAANIGLGGLLLGGMNISGTVAEHDWTALLCIVPQTLALMAIFVIWFSCFLFGDV
jgi:hypothetical protein